MPKILVIDDKADNLVVVKAICQKLIPEMKIVTALSGEEGIKVARQENPDVILLDIIMPGLDGYEVCRLLKSDPGLSIIPIILLTAILTGSHARVKGLEIGADAFLNKPINENELIAQIKVMLRIKIAEDKLRQEKGELEELVEDRTKVLHSSEQKFRALYDNSPLPYHSLDVDGNFVDVNTTWLDLLGYSREDVIGRNYAEFLHPEYVATFNKNFPNFKNHGYVSDVYFKIRHHDGTYRDINLNGNMGYNSDGSVRQSYWVFQDVSEKLKVERALASSEEQFRRAVTSSPIPIMIHDEDDNILQLSNGWTEYSGYSLKDIPTMSDWTRQAYGSDSGTEKKYIDELFEIDETVDNGEWHVTAKDGSVKIWDFKTTPLGKNSAGQRLLLSMAVDITDRKQNESNLLESESRLNRSEKIGLIGHWEFDLVDYSILWSDQVFELYQRDPKLGPPGNDEVGDYYSDEDHKRLRGYIQKIIETGLPVENFECPVIRPNGTIIHCIGSMFPTYNDEGRIIKIFGVVRDVSDQRLAEARVQKQQELISSTSSLSQIGGWEFNLETGESQFTKETFLIYGLDPLGPLPTVEEGMAYYTPEGQPLIKECFDRAIKELKPYDIEVPFVNARGESRWVRTMGEVEVKDGKAIRIFGAIQDITDAKQVEVEREEALLEAKHANEVKDQFIANISHEIRTPLNSILGFSDLFKQRYSNMIEEKDQVIFGYITESSERLMNTVDSILNMSMLKSGTISVHKEVVNMSHMAAIIANNFRVLADKKNLSLELIDSGLHSEVFVDKNCISSAIGNLTDNAIKYTAKGSISLILDVIDEHVTLSISDTGIGISDEYKQRVFEPYTQESEGFTKEYQGVGLGLALTKQFLDLNDVALELDTQKSVGTTFKLTFPKYKGKDHG